MLGKKRGRKEDLRNERLRFTASVAFHDYRIIAEYDREINRKRTNCDLEIKIFLSVLLFWLLSVSRILIRAVIQQRMVFLIHVQQDIQLL